jgi:hypothetical protein
MMMNQMGLVRTIRRYVPIRNDILRAFGTIEFNSSTGMSGCCRPQCRLSIPKNDRQRLRYFTSVATNMNTNTNTNTNTNANDASFEDNDNTTRQESIKKKKAKKSKRQELADMIEQEYRSVYNRTKTIYIKLCYTEHDIEEGDIVKAKFHWDSIIDVTSEEFGIETTNGLLEYYANENEDWVKLVPYRLYEVLQYYPCTRKEPLPVRVPSLFDEEYGTRNDLMKLKKVTPEMRKKQKQIVQMGPSAEQWLLKDTIDGIIKKLKSDGYTRSSNSTLENPLLSFQYHETDGSIKSVEFNTREYVLDLARAAPWRPPSLEEQREMEDAKYKERGMERPGSKGNPLNVRNPKYDPSTEPDIVLKKLKHVLLSQPGALNHITECLHYDFVW